MAERDRQGKALTAWLAGADYPAIARLLQYLDAEAARADVVAALEARAQDQDEELLRAGAAAMLDALQRALWTKVQDRTTDLQEATRAATVIRQIIADRRQLLGLDVRPPRMDPRHLVQPGLNLPT